MKAKKMAARLARRQLAHSQMLSNVGRYDTKVQARIRSNGYRCPGSPKQSS
jgi:hypothetical protein